MEPAVLKFPLGTLFIFGSSSLTIDESIFSSAFSSTWYWGFDAGISASGALVSTFSSCFLPLPLLSGRLITAFFFREKRAL